MDNAIAPHTQQNVSVVAFRLSQRTFALPLDVIVQILPMMTITPIPHMSKIVQGAINIRGEDVLVISLRTHFNMEEMAPQLYTPLLLLKLKERSIALIVDAVLDVMNLPLERLTDLQNMLPEGIENTPVLKGVSHYNNDTILVLDPNHLFYNQQPNTPHPVELKTRSVLDMSVMDALIEGTQTPASINAPATKKRSPIKRKSAATSEAIEDTPIATDANNKEISDSTDVPPEGVDIDRPPESPATENE
jgi:purine-binding chemotaxis protein CheW